eukprot:CAMPEP_0172698484 /NCGR_PEP_ID=MMETSP1074-20121228/29513_1 /TAXON_ID=2916 /ORGANISM="Ceratium fusus, Strain PA161109" /LENGTH=53 /DNA_ID=CAMNT_0013519535 /DNA_START=30 /DNA_END=191 /DNA_ORIENTATION=-
MHVADNVLEYNQPVPVVYMVPVYSFPSAVVYLYSDDVEDAFHVATGLGAFNAG